MTYDVYGWLDSSELDLDQAFLSAIECGTGLGVRSIPVTDLHHFPGHLLPKENRAFLAFVVSDRPGKANASYLIDPMDYAPQAEIGLPTAASARLGLLLQLIRTMISTARARRFVIALTDCSQIDDCKTVDLARLSEVIREDFSHGRIPDCAYDVVVPATASTTAQD